MRQLTVLLIVIATAAVSDTLLVPSEYASIYDAITAAQSGDTVLVSPGQYNGGFSFQGKNIVLTSTNGASSTFLKSPFADFHCVIFSQGEDSTAVLEGFSITNWGGDNEVPEVRGDIDGGGIYIKDSSPTIRNNIIYGCWVMESGAGIFIENSYALIEDNTLVDNYAHGSGGALCAHGSSASGHPIRIVSCVIDGNTSQGTAGLHISHSNTYIINNTITNNQGAIGGIRLCSQDIYVYGNLLLDNHGSSGGGMNISGSTNTSIKGNVIAENTAGLGGGIYEDSNGLVQLVNNTIAFNTSTSSGGWGGGIISWKDTLYIANSILWANSAANGSQISLPATTNPSTTIIDYCDIQFGEDSIYLGPIAVLDWGPGNIDTDPLFESGSICDYHLSLISPCIDAGNPAPEYNDPEDPFNPGYALWPAMGYLRNDMGAFGGGSVGYWLSVEDEEQSPSTERTLSLVCSPNPFRSSCSIAFQTEQPSHITLQVFDLSGRLVDVLADGEYPSGLSFEEFDASGLSSGVYLIRLSTDSVCETGRCLLIR